MLSKACRASTGIAARGCAAEGTAAFSSLTAPERRWNRYNLPQWSLNPRAARKRPSELAVWDKLVEPAPAKASVTVADVLTASTESHGHSDAFGAAGVEEEFLWDFPTMRYIVRGFGAGLVDLGHKHGSKYATWGHAGPETVALALAGAQVGAVNVHLPADATTEEAAAVVQQEQVRTLYFQERLGQRDVFEEVVSEFAPNAHAGGEINWLDSKKFRSLKHLVNATGEAYTHGTMTLNATTPYDMDPNPADAVRKWLHADDVVLQPFARTSKGLEKQAAVTGADALATAGAVSKTLGLGAADRLLLLVDPSTKVGLGCLVACLQQHVKIVTAGRGFVLADVEDALDKQRPTHIVCTEEQAAQLAGSATFALRAGLVVGSGTGASIGGVALTGVDVAATAAKGESLKVA